MAYPDFSEFTFGYAVTRTFENMFGGRVAVPTFPTQNEEADEGYDVSFLSHGFPVFIQYKRSSVIGRRDCKELRLPHISRYLTTPFYRMSLHRKNNFHQHFLLRDLERRRRGGVYYCTSAVRNKDALDEYYREDEVLDACQFFRPREIHLPNTNEDHFVSFQERRALAFLFSRNGLPFERHYRDPEKFRLALRDLAARSPDEDLAELRHFVEDLNTIGPEGMAQRERNRSHEDAVEAADADGWPIEWDRESTNPTTEVSAHLLAPYPDYSRSSFRRHDAEYPSSVVKRMAFEAYFEMDAYLIAIPRERF